MTGPAPTSSTWRIRASRGFIGRLLFTPLSALVWLVGVVNAMLTPWGLVKYWWVLVKLLLTTLMLCLVVFLLYPGLAQAGELAGALPSRDRINMVVAAVGVHQPADLRDACCPPTSRGAGPDDEMHALITDRICKGDHRFAVRCKRRFMFCSKLT